MITLTSSSPQRDEWEDWEDDDDHKMTTTVLSNHHHNVTFNSSEDDTNTTRHPQHRTSVQRPSRIKSKGRQKAQNAKAGIKLVTDMSKFRRPAIPGPKSALASARDDKRGKFSDAAALLALEGEPNSASIGSFSWLKKKQGYSRYNKSLRKHARGPSADLTPTERPIMIGISVPEENVASHQVSPWTAVLETPANMFGAANIPSTQRPAISTSPQQLQSVWSPDTEASISPQQGLQQYPGISVTQQTDAAPPLPATTRFKQTIETAAADDDDLDTPCTLFEEDGSPLATRKSLRPPVAAITPDSAASRSHGWWDHVTTPFSAKSGPFSAKTPLDVTSATTPIVDEWWTNPNEKVAEMPSSFAADPTQSRETPQPEKIVTVPARETTTGNTSEKVSTAAQGTPTFAYELPPPYSPPKEQVKYAVVLPPSQLFPQQPRVSSPRPSTRPSTPGLPGTMTSQGSAVLSDVPLTPAAFGQAGLPDRAPGSLPGDHFLDARGAGNKTERQRRRYEKEDVVARKVGGYWRGRGCMPENGCMGRGGREGRQRRRMWLIVAGGVLALLILAIVLVVVLTRKTVVGTPAATGSPATTESPVVVEEPQSIFLNVTNFPPMPTGVLTMSGPDNSVAFSDCMHQGTPKTSWSCSLPKEEHASVAPFAANQPEFIFQVQYDNHTQALWDVPEGADPTTAGFATSPAPPTFRDMDFLGKTSDGIVSKVRAGEATPFYISLLQSVNDTVGPNVLARRQGFNNQIGSGGNNGTGNSNIADSLPRPKLKADGTVAPAQLFPRPVQQPVRLYDRGLPTEHYGFYTYFNKTIFMDDNVRPSSLDRDGGASREDANYLIVFSQARFRVQLWTRKSNGTQLLDKTASIYSTGRTGAMPYPVTVTEDMHGGNPNLKVDYFWGLTEDKHVNTTNAKLITADRGFGGQLVNPMGQRDPLVGGIDGGTGGCRCEWVNFKK